jgi:hypothetical protein
LKEFIDLIKDQKELLHSKGPITPGADVNIGKGETDLINLLSICNKFINLLISLSREITDPELGSVMVLKDTKPLYTIFL